MAKGKIRICMLGKFEVRVDKKPVLTQIAQSRKVLLLLQYLLLARDRSIPHRELTDAIWAGESAGNPDMALRAILHRFRTLIDTEGPAELSNCILTSRGYYQWNTSLDCEVDVYTMQTLLDHTRYEHNPDHLIRLYEQVLALYNGRLLPASGGERWVESRSLELHTQYKRGVAALVDLYKGREDPESVIRVCRRALEVDIYDERLHMELAMALNKVGRKEEAKAVMVNAGRLGYRSLSASHVSEIDAAYRTLARTERHMENDIDNIYNELSRQDSHTGALVCDMDTFTTICHLQARMRERYGGLLYLALVTITSTAPDVDPAETAKMMEILERVLRQTLRASDVLSRYDANQYVLMLTGANTENGISPLERVKTEFYRDAEHSAYLLSYRVRTPQKRTSPGAAGRSHKILPPGQAPDKDKNTQ